MDKACSLRAAKERQEKKERNRIPLFLIENLYQDKRLSSAAKLIWEFLHDSYEDKFCMDMTFKDLGEEIGLGKEIARRAVSQLEKHGYIKINLIDKKSDIFRYVIGFPKAKFFPLFILGHTYG